MSDESTVHARELLKDARGRIDDLDGEVERLERKIAALKKERGEVEAGIRYLERVAKDGTSAETSPGTDATDRSGSFPEPGPYEGLTITDAAEKALEKLGPPFRETKELISEMESGGWTTDAKNAYTSVFGTLNRQSKKNASEVVKRDSKWGLRKWDSEKEKARDGTGDVREA